jgi:hypothetical protein
MEKFKENIEFSIFLVPETAETAAEMWKILGAIKWSYEYIGAVAAGVAGFKFRFDDSEYLDLFKDHLELCGVNYKEVK